MTVPPTQQDKILGNSFLFPNRRSPSKRGENTVVIGVAGVESQSDLTLPAVVPLKTLILRPE